MQLILETENASINIQEKMSVAEPNPLIEKPTLNGVIEEIKEKTENGINNVIEKIQSIENVVTNSTETVDHQESLGVNELACDNPNVDNKINNDEEYKTTAFSPGDVNELACDNPNVDNKINNDEEYKTAAFSSKEVCDKQKQPEEIKDDNDQGEDAKTDSDIKMLNTIDTDAGILEKTDSDVFVTAANSEEDMTLKGEDISENLNDSSQEAVTEAINAPVEKNSTDPNSEMETKNSEESLKTGNSINLAQGEGKQPEIVDDLDIDNKEKNIEEEADMLVEVPTKSESPPMNVEMPDTTLNNVQEAPDKAGGDSTMVTEEPVLLESDSKNDNVPENTTTVENSCDVSEKPETNEQNENISCVETDLLQGTPSEEVTELYKNESVSISMDTDCSESSQLKLSNSVQNTSQDEVLTIPSSESEKLNNTSNDQVGDQNDEPIEPMVSTIEPMVSTIEPMVSTIKPMVSTIEPMVSTIKPMVSTIEPMVEVPEKHDDEPLTEINVEKDEIVDVDEIKIIEDPNPEADAPSAKAPEEKADTQIIKLSNSMDILSDEEDEPSKEPQKEDVEENTTEPIEKQCINLDDDDDVMLIDDDVSKEEKKETNNMEIVTEKPEEQAKPETDIVDLESPKEEESNKFETAAKEKEDSTKTEIEVKEDTTASSSDEKTEVDPAPEILEKPKPLVPDDFFKSYRKNLVDMTRNDLEEFCILKIVESIIDRTNLNEIRTKLKNLAQTIEEYKKKTVMLAKQNRDLQVVLKSVQEEQKKRTDQPIIPLRITRSVGMQVLMTDKSRRKNLAGPTPHLSTNSTTNTNNVGQLNNKVNNNTRPVRNVNQPSRAQNQKVASSPQNIPVPRLVPALNTATNKTTAPQAAAKASPIQNGTKNTTPQKSAEKRPRMQSQSSSETVDLTDDEPPTKVMTKTSPPVRLVNQQNLMAPRPSFNSPRKVYIPISGPQAGRQGQAIMLKTVPQGTPGPRPRGPVPPMVRAPQNAMQVRRVQAVRHPAPLPDNLKQYQPPNWKALPPAPDLKLSKVENGIVISWKIEGYQEDSYEEIASYQLYAYQETSAPPSTTLWKKIGDVKALPLPMACTLTQFMAGYKYYFAVRAVDVKSRLGPFSLPGSILLLNKM